MNLPRFLIHSAVALLYTGTMYALYELWQIAENTITAEKVVAMAELTLLSVIAQVLVFIAYKGDRT